MSNKKFIGGGFPGIRECIDEINNITKESREKREFSVRKIIPINLILAKHKPQTVNNFNLSEEFNIKNDIKYTQSSDQLSNKISNTNFSNYDLNLINGPVTKLSESENSDYIIKSKTKSSKTKSSKTKSSNTKSSKRNTKNN